MMRGCKDECRIRKGPWSAEEDEVLIEFVNKNGPRDWSSIQSKGLLPRTGKSCRLRWVNKLRPNLKVGCKFTAEEERIVVELQARLGNKWATIASYLTGRTDNDVKNFWSSRKKRLARTLNCSLHPTNKRLSQNQSNPKSATFPQLPSNLEAPETSTSSMIQLGAHPSSTHESWPLDIEPISSLPAPHTVSSGSSLSIITNPSTLSDELSWSTLSYSFPLLPDYEMKDFEPSGCCQSFPCTNACDFEMPLLGGLMEGSCSNTSKSVVPPVQNVANIPDGFFDDFPTDVFDCLDPLPDSLHSFH